jgi:[CysO sulfur-carrier protein]-S-L-cysteine hydrolase
MIRIQKQVVDQMLAHAKREAPIEACGYLAEKEGIVVSAFPMKNIDASPEHFSLEPTEQFAVVRKIRSQGLSLRGVYHSHPATPAWPSQEDLRLAFDPNLSYVIVSLAPGGRGAKAFILRNGNSEEEPLIIVDEEKVNEP